MQTSQLPVRRDSLGLSTTLDLLEDVDFESTMMVLEHTERGSGGDGATPSATRRRYSSLRRGSLEQLDLSLTSLAELFPSNGDGEGLNFLTEEHAESAMSVIEADDHRIRLPSSRASLIKAEFPHSPTLLSPTMDSFLRDTWSDVSDPVNKMRRASSKLLDGVFGHSLFNSMGASPRRLSVTLPGAASLQKRGNAPRLAMQNLLPAALPPTSLGTATASKPTKTRTTKSRASPKQPRVAKQCVEAGCGRRAQSNNRCKTHGGGARCQIEGCDKSSQGGGLCRAHGGGKKCGVAGCTKGTQRLGLCYLHGGIRRCIQEGCKKKDRGNGYCISHGGGRRCEVPDCTRSVRKGNHCQTHQGLEDGSESPFKISRGCTLHASH